MAVTLIGKVRTPQEIYRHPQLYAHQRIKQRFTFGTVQQTPFPQRPACENILILTEQRAADNGNDLAPQRQPQDMAGRSCRRLADTNTLVSITTRSMGLDSIYASGTKGCRPVAQVSPVGSIRSAIVTFPFRPEIMIAAGSVPRNLDEECADEHAPASHASSPGRRYGSLWQTLP